MVSFFSNTETIRFKRGGGGGGVRPREPWCQHIETNKHSHLHSHLWSISSQKSTRHQSLDCGRKLNYLEKVTPPHRKASRNQEPSCCEASVPSNQLTLDFCLKKIIYIYIYICIYILGKYTFGWSFNNYALIVCQHSANVIPCEIGLRTADVHIDVNAEHKEGEEPWILHNSQIPRLHSVHSAFVR